MFRWLTAAFQRRRAGVHTRIATFRPQATPPDPRTIEVEFTGRELAGEYPIWPIWSLGDPDRPYAGQTLRFTGFHPAHAAIEARVAAQHAHRRDLYHGKIHQNSFADIEAWLKASDIDRKT